MEIFQHLQRIHTYSRHSTCEQAIISGNIKVIKRVQVAVFSVAVGTISIRRYLKPITGYLIPGDPCLPTCRLQW